MKIAVITCYFDPDYVRARVLRTALKSLPGVTPIIVKNTHKGLLRYPEVLWKVWQITRHKKPDAYLLTFRGQEILPFVRLMIRKKPLIFDELIVPIAYANNEHHAKSLTKRMYYFMARRSESMYRRWLRKCYAILADTAAHAELSARTSHVNLSKYTVVPVGTDENLFTPAAPSAAKPAKFRVFYYSSGMQPLHGVKYVLETAEALRNNSEIEFLLVGGKKPLRDAATAAVNNGAHVVYEPWIPFDKLAETIQESAICLGGPFGDTPQAHHVITTKTYQMLAAGVPTIVGASEATNEYFVDKQNALVVPQADAAALAKAIIWAYKHPTELREIAANGRKLYEKQFSAVAISRILERLIAGL
jgi:glycosyltransferase involved in cell wall biosynthesis